MSGYPRGTVLASDGQPITSQSRRKLAEKLDTSLPSTERFYRGTSTVSPAWLKSVLDTAASGRPRDLINFADEMRERDERIDNAASRLEGAVSSLEWVCNHAAVDESDTGKLEAAKERAAEAEKMLRGIVFEPSPGDNVGQGGFEDLVHFCSSAFFYGWACSELQWEYTDGRWDPIRAAFRHARRFVWDSNHRIRLYDAGAKGPAGIWPGMELEPMRWLVVRGKVRPVYPARDGLCRPAARLYAFKNFSWKDLVQLSEQFGSPWILGVLGGGNPDLPEYDDDAGSVLKNVVKHIKGRTRGLIDGRDRIDVIWPELSKGKLVPVEIIEKCDDGITILFQGATQGTEIRDKGTYASAEVHKGVERDKVERYALTLSQAFTFGLLKPWNDLNYGDDLCPSFWLNAQAPDDLKGELEVDKELQKMGVPMPISYLREHYGRPAPEEGDEIAERQETGGFGLDVRPSGPVVLADKPPPVDEEAMIETFEGNAKEYLDVADRAGLKAREAALKVAENWIKDQATDPGLQRFAEGIYDALAPDYAEVVRQGKFQPIVEAIYSTYKQDVRGWPPGISFDFSGSDLLFQEALGELDTLYMSKYIDNPGAESSVKRFLRNWYGEGTNAGDIFGKRTKPETLRAFRSELGKSLKKVHDWQARRIINSSVSRVRGYAEVKQMHDARVTEMEWHANSAERVTCPICRGLHGTVVRVEQVYEHMLRAAELEPDAWIEDIKRRHDSHPITAESVEGATNEAKARFFEEYGHMQPVHPNCACSWIFRIAI